MRLRDWTLTPESFVPELIAHLFGDYILQNHTMAARKTSSSLWAAIHVAFYLIPFLFLTWSPLALAMIAGTHFVIDRFRLARYWVEFWGVGCNGWVTRNLIEPIEPAPPFLAVWLLIIVDNTFHLAINHVALTWL